METIASVAGDVVVTVVCGPFFVIQASVLPWQPNTEPEPLLPKLCSSLELSSRGDFGNVCTSKTPLRMKLTRPMGVRKLKSLNGIYTL